MGNSLVLMEYKTGPNDIIHKEREINLVVNDRLVSLTSIPRKILEHVVLHYLN